MKFIWEEKDIEVGLYIIRNAASDPIRDIGFAHTVVFKIGFIESQTEKRYCKIAVMTDGWICPIADTKADVAEKLNNDQHGYRPLKKSEFVLLMNQTAQGFLMA